MSHTPGPWEVLYDDRGRVCGVATVKREGDISQPNDDAEFEYATYSPRLTVKNHCIRIVVTDGGYYPPRLADARLIAGAPDLLAALKALLADFPADWRDRVRDGELVWTLTEDGIDAALHAIANAEGRP